MLDVLVTCHPHTSEVTMFPQVRGYYLAKHLARLGLRAEFRQLPVRRTRAHVVIVSEYQQSMGWFERHLAKPLSKIRAERLFCWSEVSLHDNPDHEFSREYCEWFAARGGVLCQAAPRGLEPYERWTGVGVDPEVVRPAPDGVRNEVVFDFPHTSTVDAAAAFDSSVLDRVRRDADLCIVGSGDPSASIRSSFDRWVPTGQPHAAYVDALLPRAAAIVPGCEEALGLMLAEAQVAGACVVSSPGQVLDEMRVSEAIVEYEAGDPDSLVTALDTASQRDHDLVRTQAIDHFSHEKVAERTRAAIGL